MNLDTPSRTQSPHQPEPAASTIQYAPRKESQVPMRFVLLGLAAVAASAAIYLRYFRG
jgi:hypothetical protein